MDQLISFIELLSIYFNAFMHIRGKVLKNIIDYFQNIFYNYTIIHQMGDY